MYTQNHVQSIYLKRLSLSHEGNEWFLRKTDSKKPLITFQETVEQLKGTLPEYVSQIAAWGVLSGLSRQQPGLL